MVIKWTNVYTLYIWSDLWILGLFSKVELGLVNKICNFIDYTFVQYMAEYLLFACMYKDHWQMFRMHNSTEVCKKQAGLDRSKLIRNAH